IQLVNPSTSDHEDSTVVSKNSQLNVLGKQNLIVSSTTANDIVGDDIQGLTLVFKAKTPLQLLRTSREQVLRNWDSHSPENIPYDSSIMSLNQSIRSAWPESAVPSDQRLLHQANEKKRKKSRRKRGGYYSPCCCICIGLGIILLLSAIAAIISFLLSHTKEIATIQQQVLVQHFLQLLLVQQRLLVQQQVLVQQRLPKQQQALVQQRLPKQQQVVIIKK
ncbi:unnamed protein product, partial [Didymodactylos carnosus]